MKGRSNQSKMELDNASTTLTPTKKMEVSAQSSAIEVQPRQTDNQGRVVALDPGVRTFMTFFSESFYGWIGNDSNLLIQKLCFRLDKLISRMSKMNSPQRKRLKKAADRLKILMEIR